MRASPIFSKSLLKRVRVRSPVYMPAAFVLSFIHLVRRWVFQTLCFIKATVLDTARTEIIFLFPFVLDSQRAILVDNPISSTNTLLQCSALNAELFKPGAHTAKRVSFFIALPQKSFNLKQSQCLILCSRFGSFVVSGALSNSTLLCNLSRG